MRRFADHMPFSPQYLFMAAKPLTYNGHDYQAGDPFPREAAEGEEPEERPDDAMLAKLYRQKRITVRATIPAEDLHPGLIQNALDAAGGADDESGQGGADDAADDAADDEPENDADAPEAADDEDPAADDGKRAGADGERRTDGSGNDGGAAEAVADQKAPEGEWTRIHEGFGKHNVVSANGVVVHAGLTKAEADAKVAEHNAALKLAADGPAPIE